MSAPDMPETAKRYIIDTIEINSIKPLPRNGKVRLSAVGPWHVINLQLFADRGKDIDDPTRAWQPASLIMWPHPSPEPARYTPLVTDLIRSLEPARWRFVIEHLAPSAAAAFSDPDAQGFQITMWLDRQHLPEHVIDHDASRPEHPPVWPRVFLFNVPGPDRTAEPVQAATETISGTVENLPREEASSTISLGDLELCTRLGQVLLRNQQPAVPGVYRSVDAVEHERW